MTWPSTADAQYKRIHYFSQFCLPFRPDEQVVSTVDEESVCFEGLLHQGQVRDDEFVFLVSSEEKDERLVCVCVVVGARSAKKVIVRGLQKRAV